MKLKILISGLLLVAVGDSMAIFTISSNSFAQGATIPEKHACSPANPTGISPQFTLRNIPSGTKGLVLIVDDPDAQTVVGHTFVHAIAKFDPSVTEFDENSLDTVAIQQVHNDANTNHYYGPCPPAGPVHHYYFTWLVLNKDIDLAQYSTQDFRDTYNNASTFYQQNKDAIIGKAQIMGLFKK